jgi:flagellar motor switch protein FliM
MSTSLSAYLRTTIALSVSSVEQYSYAEFLGSLTDPTAFYAISMTTSDELGAVEINPSIAFAMLDRMLGGSGQPAPANRPLSEIEQNVIDAVVRLLLENITELWKPVGGLQFAIHARETRPQMLQISAPNEIFILLVFDVRVGDARGMLNLALPATVIEALGSSFSQGWSRHRKEQSDRDRARLTENIGRIPMPVTGLLESTFLAGDLLQLQPGDVIALDREASAPIDIKVNGSSKFAGKLIRLPHSSGVVVDRQAAPMALEGAA